jgi:hypothetical protein
VANIFCRLLLLFLCKLVLEVESAFTHGRIPAHEFKDNLEASLLLLQEKANQSRNRAQMFALELDFESNLFLNNHHFPQKLGHAY